MFRKKKLKVQTIEWPEESPAKTIQLELANEMDT